MAISESVGIPPVEMPDLGRWAIERILEWSDTCRRFLDRERERMLLHEPSARDLAEHE